MSDTSILLFYLLIYSWASGDEFLQNFAKALQSYFTQDLVFRVFGDDFVVLCKEKGSLIELDKVLKDVMSDAKLTCRHHSVDLTTTHIRDTEDIENMMG